MHWNYRVVYHPSSTYKVGEVEFEREEYVAIHEVHYDKDGNPELVTEEARNIIGDEGSDSLISIKWTLDKMLEALQKPILDYETLKPIEKEKQNEFSKSIKTKK